MSRPHSSGRMVRAAATAVAMATIRGAIERAAVQAFGATVREESLEASGLAHRVLDEPLAGVGSARLALEVADKRLRHYALEARAAGRSWDDIAAVLGLSDHDGGDREAADPPRAETAFEWLIEGQRPRPHVELGRRSVAMWRCQMCRRRVTDRGPFESHPDDREYGHGADCPRRAAALEQWAREQDQEDDQDQEHEQEQGEDGGGGGWR